MLLLLLLVPRPHFEEGEAPLPPAALRSIIAIPWNLARSAPACSNSTTSESDGTKPPQMTRAHVRVWEVYNTGKATRVVFMG